MSVSVRSYRFRTALFYSSVIFFSAAILVLPVKFRVSAAKGLIQTTISLDKGLPNYDIRTDKSAADKIEAFRIDAGKNAVEIADIRDGFVRGENALRQSVPTLKVDYNDDIRIPEIIAADVKRGTALLTAPATGKRSNILMDFLKQNCDLVGETSEQIDDLKVVADYTNPDGNLSFVELKQEIGGIPVFRGEVKAGFTKRGEMIRVVNNLASGLDYKSLSNDFGDPLAAVRSSAKHIDTDISKLDLRKSSAPGDIKSVFGSGDSATTAEKMYFPTEPGVAVAAWRVLIWLPVNSYYVIVDAERGTLLWRKNLTEDQTQSATYRVWANPNAMINVADSPFPFTPGPVAPNGQQGAALTRSLITRIGNEPPYTFNDNGWITDGGNETDGNNVEAGLDRDTTNGVDVVNGRAPGVGRVFDYPFSPYNPNTGTGDSPTPPGEPVSGCAAIPVPHAFIDAQKAAVSQYFYLVNWAHDETYRLGFTEQARNFQHLNFGRGGVEGDRLSAESQDCSGTNGGNFSTAADGNRPRMQMFVWTGPPVDIDTAVDAEIVIHEFTHGLSNRLHGNATGLTTNMARGMGEGWSDFYAHSLLSDTTDPITGVYTIAGYTSSNIFTGFVNNYYYGTRRYPKAVLAHTGGVNNKPHNAFTFSYANSNCNARLNETNFAYAPGPVGVNSSCDQVHNLGEIWSSALWEVRGRFVARLGQAGGNRRFLQFVTDGMKLAPLAPTFLQERDAILAAAQVSSIAPEAAADVADVWAGFAARGMGIGASIQNTGSGTGNTVVTEAFDAPNLFQAPTITVTDPAGNNNGFPDPGEMISINIPLTNSSGTTATGVSLQLVGGGSANYGSIPSGTTVRQPVSYTVPSSSQCGGLVTLTLNVVSSLGPVSFTRTITIGQPLVTFSQNFDGVTAPAFPANWTSTSGSGGQAFVMTTATPDTAPNAVFAANPVTGGGTDLTSPVIPININAPAAMLTFRHSYLTEAGWDGGILEISIANLGFQDIIAAGGSFIQNGYNGTLGNGTDNPLANRQAWNGTSGGYISTIVRLPASAAGQNVQFRWRFGSDNNTGATGWSVDSVSLVGNYACTVIDNFARPRADFDGDGRTDVSTFRPSEGNWYLNRSTAGFISLHFGISDDVPAPGDFDGDGKTDISVWRPSDGNWYRLNSGNGQYVVIHFGSAGDIPQSGDYDGDGKDDIGVWRPSSGVWYWLGSSNGQVNILQFGLSGDKPVAGDYDGDARDDIAVWRPSTGVWYRINSSNGSVSQLPFGLPSDLPTPADYDGDRKIDISVFRPSDGVWYRLNSSNGQFAAINFGLNGDIPVPGDYDGDGKDDQAIYRAGIWHLNRSTAGYAVLSFGLSNDIPIPKAYIP